MKKIFRLPVAAICLAVPLTFSLPTMAQQTGPLISWQKSFGGTDNDAFTAGIQTADGGYLLVGTSSSFAGNHGGDDGVVMKINADGDTVWTKSYGGTKDESFKAIIQYDVDEDFIIVGSVRSDDVDVEGKIEGGKNDFWVVRLDDDGEIVDQGCFGGKKDDYGYAAQQDGNDILIAGSTASNDVNVSGNHIDDNGDPTTDVWVAKLDANLNLVAQKCYGGTGFDYATGLAFGGGNYYFSGSTNSLDGDIANGYYTNHGLFDGFTVEFNINTLSIINLFCWGGENNDYYNAVATTDDGRFAFAGSSRNETNGVDAMSMLFDQSVQGPSYTSVDGETGIDSLTSVCSYGNYNFFAGTSDGKAWIIKKDLEGNIVWQATYGEPGTIINSITALGGGSYFVTGSTISPNGDTDAWVAMLTGDFGTPTFNVQSPGSINIYPNPIVSSATISFNGKKYSQLEVINANGRIVRIEKITSDSDYTFYRDNLPAGNYILRISGGMNIRTKKVVIH